MLADILHKIASMERDEDKPYYPRPSMAGSQRCIRSMVYHKLGFKREPLPGRTLFIFDDGNWHEELTMDWIRKTAFQAHSTQMEITCFHVNGKPVKGHIDGIVTDLLGIDRVLEHKSLNHFSFEKYIKGEEFPLDYIAQSCSYIKGVQEENPDVDEAILLIKNKNTSAYLEYIIHYDIKKDICTIKQLTNSNGKTEELNYVIENIIADIVKKFEAVEDYAMRRSLPKRPHDMSDWQCDYCAWGKICWEGYEKEFKALATDAIIEGEIAEKSAYYLETDMHYKEMEKERDELKGKIKEILKEKGVREGRAGNYTIKLALQNRSKLNKDVIPKAILEKATIPNPVEILTIRNISKGDKNVKTSNL